MADNDHNKDKKFKDNVDDKDKKHIVDDEDEYVDNAPSIVLTSKRKMLIILMLLSAVFALWFLFKEDKSTEERVDSTSDKNIVVGKSAEVGIPESDRIINNVVDAVGAEQYAGIDSLPKLDISEKSVTPPPLVIPSVPVPEPVQPLDVGNLDVPSLPVEPEPIVAPLAPPVVIPSSPSNKPLIPPGLDIGGDSGNSGDNGRNSNMIVFGAGSGSGVGSASGAIANNAFPGGFDPSNPLSGAKGLVDSIAADKQISVNDSIPPAQTSAGQIMATAYGRRETMVAQGKVVDIVLETAINTDLQGTVRAVVSRDVYSEGGNNVLIPRGSRVIGNYAASGDNARTRLDIAWTRVMRSDGIDLITDAKAIDNLGRNGASGEVDFKIIEAIRNALLVSSITISTAALAQKIAGNDKVATTQDQDGKVSILAQPIDSAIKDSSQQISKALTDAVKRGVSTKPIIKIDQGTKLKIFVNQDIIFSRSIANLNKVN
ncbi:type IV secretion system protein VirB10 [Candidatus Xenohaliotis californiensis]|uniref:Type IV secretion system protein VirB10 n=1 Tax=Candidatus Xenohaliotis californiensis TaxID=84677 RepID=A0ABP0EWB9_9RICK|nr:type IV secretion system protein VirB10 [Candidatus Xenohaliotis californiensis]